MQANTRAVVLPRLKIGRGSPLPSCATSCGAGIASCISAIQATSRTRSRGSRCFRDQVEPAIERRQLEFRASRDVYLPDGKFEIERMLSLIREEHARALADGYEGLGLTGEVDQCLGEAPWFDLLSEYEHRIADLLRGGTLSLLCQYDHRVFGAGALSEIAEAHAVDVSPELAPIGRDGYLAAARIRPLETLRLAGELDFGSADALADVLAAHFHGELRLDLADLEYVDISGMRALRGRVGRPIHITAASESVRRLVDLLAWDTDPDVAVAP